MRKIALSPGTGASAVSAGEGATGGMETGADSVAGPGTESGSDTGSGGWVDGGFDPLASDPLMSPAAGLSLHDFLLRLGDGEPDDGALLQTAESAGDPELAALTEDLLLLLGDSEFALASAVPSDAFNGVATVIVPGLIRFEPAADRDDALDVVFQPAGFAVYQF